MLIRKASDIPSSEITSKSDYMNRRKFMTGAVALGVAALGADRVKDIASPREAVHATSKLADDSQQVFDDRGNADLLPGHHHLQQLLRIRHRQGRSCAQRRAPEDPPVERKGRWRGEESRRYSTLTH